MGLHFYGGSLSPARVSGLVRSVHCASQMGIFQAFE